VLLGQSNIDSIIACHYFLLLHSNIEKIYCEELPFETVGVVRVANCYYTSLFVVVFIAVVVVVVVVVVAVTLSRSQRNVRQMIGLPYLLFQI
jgi:hypothetical protein